MYVSIIRLCDGSYGPSVPWQTSTCKHAAAQAWIQSCFFLFIFFYKKQLLQECNICQFQRAVLLHLHSSHPKRKVSNKYAELRTNVHATNWPTMSCLTMFLDAVINRVFRKLLFHDNMHKLILQDPHRKINITWDINFTIQEITFLPLEDQHTDICPIQ